MKRIIIKAKTVNIYNTLKGKGVKINGVKLPGIDEDDDIESIAEDYEDRVGQEVPYPDEVYAEDNGDGKYIKDSWVHNPNLRDQSFEETLSILSLELALHNKGKTYDIVYEQHEGQIAVIQTLRHWAWEFEEKYKGHEFGEDDGPEWYEAIDTFLEEKLKEYIS